MYGPLCPLLEMTRWQGMRRGTWQRQMDRGKEKKNSLRETRACWEVCCFCFLEKIIRDFLFFSSSPALAKTFGIFERFFFRFLCVCANIGKPLSSGAQVLNFGNGFSSVQITHRKRGSFYSGADSFPQSNTTVGGADNRYVLCIKNKLSYWQTVWLKSHQKDRKSECAFYFSLSLFLHWRSMRKQSGTAEVSGLILAPIYIQGDGSVFGYKCFFTL